MSATCILIASSAAIMGALVGGLAASIWIWSGVRAMKVPRA